MADWIIQPLTNDHQRTAFSCGKPPLDDFIRSRVSQYERRQLGRTFVATSVGQKLVSGYYTLAAGSIAFAHLPSDASRKLPKHPVPVVLLARLAVDAMAQGCGLGEELLLDALERALGLSDRIGIHAIEVHALDDGATAFYRKYGFIPLLDDSRHMYLPIATIKNVFG